MLNSSPGYFTVNDKLNLKGPENNRISWFPEHLKINSRHKIKFKLLQIKYTDRASNWTWTKISLILEQPTCTTAKSWPTPSTRFYYWNCGSLQLFNLKYHSGWLTYAIFILKGAEKKRKRFSLNVSLAYRNKSKNK